MQVADMSNKASAAVLGAQKTRSVTMVEDAGFLMMLSSNLYSNQLLAAIREPLCNAWDAHIEAGKTDVPIKVTITKDHEFILQDFGLGIPDDKIEQVYGTYGGSTKRNDSKTTGGFGLGSKAPWAIVDAFRVTSRHNGVMTVYNMARACIETDGKPGITPIISDLPTTESGLTVSFILQEDQVKEVIAYVKYIALHGEMEIEFNTPDGLDHSIDKLNMSTEPGSYNIDASKWYARYMGDHKIFIRYGSVIYPALRIPGTEKALKLLEDFISIVDVNRIVVQAAPDTLALTPSREALSSQKMTENGITQLCLDLVASIEADIIKRLPQEVDKALQYISSGKAFVSGYSYSFGQVHGGIAYIKDRMVRKYLQSRLGITLRAKYEPAFKQAIRAANKLWFPKGTEATKGSKELSRLHFEALDKHISTRAAYKYLGAKYIRAPFYKLMSKHNIDLNNIYLCSKRYYSLETFKYKDHGRMQESGVFNYLRLPNNNMHVFITTRVKGVCESVKHCPSYDSSDAAWVVKVKPNIKDAEKDPIVTTLKNAGYSVVDLTLNHEWDPAVKAKALAALTKPEKVKETKTRSVNRLTPLTYFADGNKWDRTRSFSNAPDVSKTTDIKYYIEWDHLTKSDKRLGNYFLLKWATLEDLKQGVVVRNGIEKRMAVTRGAIPVNDFFIDRLLAYGNTPEIRKYFSKQRKISISTDHYISSQTIKLCRHFGISLPGYDKMIYNSFYEEVRYLLSQYKVYLQQLLQESDPDSVWLYDLLGMKLEVLPFIKKLVTLEKDRMLADLTRNKSIFQWMTVHPERSAALKSLVLSALKTVNTKP